MDTVSVKPVLPDPTQAGSKASSGRNSCDSKVGVAGEYPQYTCAKPMIQPTFGLYPWSSHAQPHHRYIIFYLSLTLVSPRWVEVCLGLFPGEHLAHCIEQRYGLKVGFAKGSLAATADVNGLATCPLSGFHIDLGVAKHPRGW
jgi:hypothetical protein